MKNAIRTLKECLHDHQTRAVPVLRLHLRETAVFQRTPRTTPGKSAERLRGDDAGDAEGMGSCGMTETKRCPTCKEIKLVSEFYKNRSATDGLSHECKSCRGIYNKNQRVKSKPRRCAKIFCSNPKVNKRGIVRLTCVVCGEEYGMIVYEYENKMQRPDGYYPKYCSRSCQNIGMSKKWQQTQSPYAKKIKELQKVYK